MIIYTIGHGTRTLTELAGILQAANIELLVDVRQYPASRTNPQFNRDWLKRKLPSYGIGYRFMGRQLGGRRGTSEQAKLHTSLKVTAFRNYAGYMMRRQFLRGIEQLEKLAEKRKVCIMCSETLWYRCHRRMISDFLTKRKHKVYHLGMRQKPIKHVVWDVLRKRSGVLYYDR